MLEDRAAASSLCTADEFTPWKTISSGSRSVKQRSGRSPTDGSLEPVDPTATAGTPAPASVSADRRVHGPIEGRIGAGARMCGRDDEGISHLVMVPDRSAARRPSHQWGRLPAGIRPDLGQVAGNSRGSGSVPSSHRCAGTPTRRARGDRVEHGLVDRHVRRRRRRSRTEACGRSDS